MSEFATSADGTRIAYDRFGSGPVLIFVDGAMQFRAFDPQTGQLAEKLAERGLTTVRYDRRGRGESVFEGPSSLDQEVADLTALIEELGGPAALYGSSSGGAIALAAAAAGLPVSRLALWEVPLDAELGDEGARFLAGLRDQISTGDTEASLLYFMQDMPAEWVEGSRNSPAWEVMKALTPSLVPDSEALAWTQRAPRAELFAPITVPVLAMLGEQTLPLFPVAAESIASSVADGQTARVAGADHQWDLDAMTSTLADYLRG